AEGGEHPMWLVTAPTPMVSGRKSFLGTGFIDRFFDYWLPVFVHEMRYSEQRIQGRTHEEAVEFANSRYQEVHSKDGVSRPIKDKMGLDKYGGKTALDDYTLPELLKEQERDIENQDKAA
ncbi:unnamed protein product, partial [Effrenium voratum]